MFGLFKPLAWSSRHLAVNVRSYSKNSSHAMNTSEKNISMAWASAIEMEKIHGR
jgi:hypothetical protein